MCVLFDQEAETDVLGAATSGADVLNEIFMASLRCQIWTPKSSDCKCLHVIPGIPRCIIDQFVLRWDTLHSLPSYWDRL